jgi:glycosyl transferase family 4
VTVAQTGLRVLIANRELWSPSGTVMYVRDLALELQRQGHTPAVFSSTRGRVPDELGAAGVVVSDRLNRHAKPDIIHGHHHAPTVVAMRHWLTVPGIQVCHDHLSAHDRTVLDTRVRRHFGVSRVCVKRLVDDGVAADHVALLPNFADMARFRPRPRLPVVPRRGLVLSNYAHARTHLPAVRAACMEAGIELDVAGIGVDNIVDQPESMLGSYDIVFAKGKAAIEAMAVGSAVVLCDYAGVGPMVTSDQFDSLRERNFGFETLREPLHSAPILREIARYDPFDAERVRDLTRASAGVEGIVEKLVTTYREVIAEQRSKAPAPLRADDWSRFESARLRLYWTYTSIPWRHRRRINRLPGLRHVINGLRRLP